MLAKLISIGRNREEAITRMRRALAEMKVDGIRTNIAFHQKVMEDPRFVSGNFSTKFLEDWTPPDNPYTS